MEIIWTSVAAGGGGLVAGLLGWLQSKEPFMGRKYAATVVRALVAGGAFAYGSQFLDFSWPTLIAAFLSGAGIDAGLHRLSGTIKES